MIKIEYPPYHPGIRKEKGREFIFDETRKRWVALTPEEWVRQNFLAYLVKVKNIPPSLIAVEKEIQLGELKKRFDIVVYNRQTKPFMLVECKEMGVELNPKVLDQVLRYNIAMQVPYVVITNGHCCMAFSCADGAITELAELPSIANG